MSYVDGYVLPVPKKKLAEYTRMARQAGKLWMKHGALDYKECAGDDLTPKGFPMVTFPKLMKLRPGETAVFSYIVFKSRAHRDAVNARVMKDIGPAPMEHPFDVKRMVYGGFKTIVDLG